MRPSQQITCSNCQSEMFLGHTRQGPAGYDIRIFECHRCPHQLTTAVRIGDPMQSTATLDWLQGQLAGPK